MAAKTSLENKHLGNGDYFEIIVSFIVVRARCKWTGKSPVEVIIANERFKYCCAFTMSKLEIWKFHIM